MYGGLAEVPYFTKCKETTINDILHEVDFRRPLSIYSNSQWYILAYNFHTPSLLIIFFGIKTCLQVPRN